MCRTAEFLELTYLQRKYHLTPRELQTAIAVCSGCNNRQIAEKLGIEINTAKAYLGKIYLKAGVNSKTLLLLKFMGDTQKNNHTRDLKGHITAYQRGEIGEETLITLIEVSLVKLKLSSEKIARKIIGEVDGG